jgi:hypothetical protein
LLLVVSTHATYITYEPVERLVPSLVQSIFSAACEAVPLCVHGSWALAPEELALGLNTEVPQWLKPS